VDQKVEWQLRCELAATYRLVHHFRMTDLIFTHISLRLPGPEPTFLINPYGLLFDEITASSLVKVDARGALLDDNALAINPAGFVIHSAIHGAREDAHCVLHTHSRAGCAVAASDAGLLPLNQISLEFYGRIGYHDYEGIALNHDEQRRLVASLADRDVMILRNHGLLTVGKSPQEAFLRMYYLDKACQIQLDALAAGPVRLPPVAVCEYTAAQYRGDAPVDYPDPYGYDLAWAALLRLLEKVAPDYAT
jgi:ribulose-5-phosphate 4-epimerase/fuculose-1-phosphate aldolase